MIYTGNQGCICFYSSQDKLASSCPLSDTRSIDYYTSIASELVVNGLRMGYTIPQLRNLLKIDYDQLCSVKRYKLTKSDEAEIGACALALVKLKVYDFDDICFVAPKYKKKNRRLMLRKKKEVRI
tara:strand:+ start:1169 stop:1543 length:375 start_codon:yes stop_codon:yes gene_type:complete